MKKLMLIVLALMALMISVPAAKARDANQDSMRQEWKAITAQQKQQEGRFKAVNAETPKVVQTSGAGTAVSATAK